MGLRGRGRLDRAAASGYRERRTVAHQLPEERVISSKIFVGNLSFDTTADQLSAFLAPAGSIVDVFIPNDRVTGRPRGFAFVEFASEQEAEQAIERFDGAELEGRNLRINAAEDRPPRASGGPSFGGGPPGGPPRGRGGPGGKPKGSRRGLRGKKRSL
ncbi:MAG TPA: RNA-binding protein [Thermoanaerobaculia bacterium]|nr:RNA-binding protein [Thermoanaerobaculia bacterium]